MCSLSTSLQCEGYLDWLTVPRNEKIVNITLPTSDIYQFAVAANAQDRSSGMIWATCTILHNKGSYYHFHSFTSVSFLSFQ